MGLARMESASISGWRSSWKLSPWAVHDCRPVFLACSRELGDGDFCGADEGAQGSFRYFLVVGYGQCGTVILLDQNDVTATLSGLLPSRRFEDLYDFPIAEDRQDRH